MTARKVDYTDGATHCIGEFHWDEGKSGPRPGVVVFPEAFGLNDHAKERARRLADLGFAALAADMHGDAQVFDAASLSSTIQGYYGDRAHWRRRAQAALDALTAQPEVDGSKVAAIGFCFGGATCLELVRTGAPLTAIVTFHGGLLPEMAGDAGRIQSSVLVCHGADDPLVQDETMKAVMDEFRRDKVDWQVLYLGNAVHSFTDPLAGSHGIPGLAYDATAEARSWTAMCNLFSELFG